MIKSKAFSTFIVCSILISGISNSYIFGNDEEKLDLINGYDKEAQTSSSICTLRNAGKAFIGLLVLGAATFGGYEYGKNSTSPSLQTPTLPLQSHHPMLKLHNPKPSLVCPALIRLNGERNCSSGETEYWPGAHMGEAEHSQECLPDCTNYPDMEQDSFKAPKTFIVDVSSPNLKPLLDKMLKDNVPYYMGGFAIGFAGQAFNYYTYDSATGFKVPIEHFTVEEIENDPEAMAVIKAFFEFQNDFNPTPCDKFRLVEGSSSNARSANKKQQRKLIRNSKKRKRR